MASSHPRPDAKSLARAALAHAASLSGRVLRAFLQLEREQRMAAIAAFLLFASMFLPWYSKNQEIVSHGKGLPVNSHLTAWGAFSWVEAGVLLIAFGILVMLFKRAEGRAFHLPGGDGTVILAGGAWAGVLIFYRFFDKRTSGSQNTATFGVTWGIFFALCAAAFLAYAGQRVRHAGRPEPALPAPGAEHEDDEYFDDEDEDQAPPPPPRRQRAERREPAPTRPRRRPAPVYDEEADDAEYAYEDPPTRRRREDPPAPPTPRPRRPRVFDERLEDDEPVDEPARPRYPPPPPRSAPTNPGPVTPAGRRSRARREPPPPEEEQLSFEEDTETEPRPRPRRSR